MKRMAKGPKSRYNASDSTNKDMRLLSRLRSWLAPPPALASRPAARTLWYWAPVAGYAAVIFGLSSLSTPGVSLPCIIPFGDKVLHAGVYGGLALLALRAFRHAGGSKGARYALGLAIAAAALYGVTDELHQLFVPQRHADPWDWLADVGGACVATVAWQCFVWQKPSPPTALLSGFGMTDEAG